MPLMCCRRHSSPCRPEIVNTDQGSQFTLQEFVQAGREQGYNISMDGRGAWRDIVRRAPVEIGEIRAGVFACL